MRLRPLLPLTLTAALLLATAAVTAQTTPARPAASAKAPAKPATPRQQLKSEARGLALASQTVEEISQAQLEVAARVLTGTADCEFNQHISVTAIDGQPGHFLVGHKGLRYRMTPRETSTGAVRLEDKAAGVVWLQIPAKSMLMNARIGQRLVDSCQHAEQRVAMAAAPDSGIGIVPQAAAAPAPAPAPVAPAPAEAAAPQAAASAP